ncbi:uncharacterized protein LOC142342913 [Convolutriloba macropyga]|uniref:uncharacterized protein LOC142342913 n=1 Tax=Convolutriloba macropyga TaxID=536237 RepID=UPI003F51D0A4
MEMKPVKQNGGTQAEDVQVGNKQREQYKLGRRPALGKFLGLLSLVCFIFINILFKKSQVTPPSIMIFRGLSLFFIFGAGQMYEVPDLYASYQSNCYLITARCIVSSLAIATGIFCVQTIPLSIYGLIFELSPVFALIMSAIILRECIPPVEILLGTVAIFGVVLVIQPPFEFLGFAQLESKLTTYQELFPFPLDHFLK